MVQAWPVNLVVDGFRFFLASLDWVVYSLLMFLYQIFFNVASAVFLKGETIRAFYGRIQIILGIFMLFKLAISLVNAIVNPDTLTDKDKGFSKIITRMVIALIMLSLIIPINIPKAEPGSYEAQVNNNGILFGTLYEFQERILSQNTIARLIIGAPADTYSDTSSSISTASKEFASIVLKTFIQINLKADDGDPRKSDDRACDTTTSQIYITEYQQRDVDPTHLIDYINVSCSVDPTDLKWDPTGQKERYVFAYTPVISTIAGGLFCFIFAGFTIDIAVRAMKLAILRLIAPIPIISYIDPKSSKDGAFAAWSKAVMSTYLDLFLRLAIIYFVLFIINDIIDNGIYFDIEGNYIIILFSTLFIFIGLFFFAKHAPRFITDSLGIKPGNMGNIGLNGLLAGATTMIGRGGAGAAAANVLGTMRDTAQANAEHKQAPGGWSAGSDAAARIRLNDPNAKGGILNGIMRKASISSADKHGLSQAEVDADRYGDRFKDLKVDVIPQVNRDMSEEQKTLAGYRQNMAVAQQGMAQADSRLQHNYSTDVRSNIEQLKANGASDADIVTAATTGGWADAATVSSYMADSHDSDLARSQYMAAQSLATDSEQKVADYQDILRGYQEEMGQAEYFKGKAEAYIKDAEASHQITGGYAKRIKSNYKVPPRLGADEDHPFRDLGPGDVRNRKKKPEPRPRDQ